MSTKKKRIALLLDGDYLIFSALSAAEEEVDWGEDVWSLQCDHKKARAILQGTIKSIKERLREFNDAELVMIFSTLDGNDNWRKQVLTSYKANRKGKRKPVGYREFLKECMEDTETYMRTFQWDGLEGDDTIGILATNPEYLGVDEAIPVSCDKDFKTIPGRFLWLTENKVLTLSGEEADMWHLFQTIKGDTTDGYGGIPGCGEQVDGVPIMEWLQAPTFFYQDVKVMKSGPRKGQEVPFWTKREPEGESLWECIVSLATKQGMSEEDLIVQAQVARICRNEDFDWATMRPIPWHPEPNQRLTLMAA